MKNDHLEAISHKKLLGILMVSGVCSFDDG